MARDVSASRKERFYSCPHVHTFARQFLSACGHSTNSLASDTQWRTSPRRPTGRSSGLSTAAGLTSSMTALVPGSILSPRPSPAAAKAALIAGMAVGDAPDPMKLSSLVFVAPILRSQAVSSAGVVAPAMLACHSCQNHLPLSLLRIL